MQAAVFLEQDQPLSIEERQPDRPRPARRHRAHHRQRGVSLRPLRDQRHAPRGPEILGHEGTGIVESVGGDVTGVQVGDRVIGSFIPACGVCWYCLHDQSNLCAETYPVMFVPRARSRRRSASSRRSPAWERSPR